MCLQRGSVEELVGRIGKETGNISKTHSRSLQYVRDRLAQCIGYAFARHCFPQAMSTKISILFITLVK